MNQLQLREATPDDAEIIAELLAELGYPQDPADIPARIETARREGGNVFLAVDSHGSRLGLMALSRHSAIHVPGQVAYIDALVTSSKARRRGVGRFLVAEGKRWAANAGCARLTLTSAEHRSAAHEFYPSCGMPYTGRRYATPIDVL